MNKRKTTEDFIAEAKLVHGDKYDYSKTNYINSRIKVTIICSKHGEFEQIAKSHSRGNGCKACAMEYVQNKNKKTQQICIKDFVRIHGNKYDYSKVDYIDDATKVVIICPTHGEFSQIPSAHIQKCGCPKCGIESTREKRTIPFETFVKNAIKVHGNKFTYFKNDYVSYKKSTAIKCNQCSTIFKTSPQHHAGPDQTGCPSCAISGFQPNKPAYLYYLKVTTNDGQILYKLGITNRTVNERFNLSDLAKIEIVKQKLYENGQDALDWETKLKRMYKEYQYKGPDILSSGNTELFTEDIMKLYSIAIY